MNRAVTSIVEADIFLAAFTEWINLTDPVKTFYLSRASVYVQLRWTCVEDVVWEGDDLDIPEEIKEAVAYYAFADYSGTLYGDVTTPDVSVGGLRSQKDKIGELSTEESWFRGGGYSRPSDNRALGYPNSLMSVWCERANQTTELTRV